MQERASPGFGMDGSSPRWRCGLPLTCQPVERSR